MKFSDFIFKSAQNNSINQPTVFRYVDNLLTVAANKPVFAG
jgi:hypothetical protein